MSGNIGSMVSFFGGYPLLCCESVEFLGILKKDTCDYLFMSSGARDSHPLWGLSLEASFPVTYRRYKSGSISGAPGVVAERLQRLPGRPEPFRLALGGPDLRREISRAGNRRPARWLQDSGKQPAAMDRSNTSNCI